MLPAELSPVTCRGDVGLLQAGAAAALGTVEVMVGLFNVALGAGRTSARPGDFTDLRAALWLGAVFAAAGVAAALAGRCPSVCSVGFAVLMNIVGSVFAVLGIVLYAIDLGDASVASMCSWNQPGGDDAAADGCIYVALLAQRFLTGMDVTLMVLAVLQLCVCISFAVLGIRALVGGDADISRPMWSEALMIRPGA